VMTTVEAVAVIVGDVTTRLQEVGVLDPRIGGHHREHIHQ